MHHARTAKKTLLLALGAIAMDTHSPAKFTSNEVDRLLYHVATYAYDGMMFHEIKMKLADHSDAHYLSENKSKSRASAHMGLSENIPIPSFNGVVITIAQIIKSVMSSAAEAELISLFITARKCVKLRYVLIEMRWP